MAFHRPSFFPFFERAPHHTTTENPLRAVIHLVFTVPLLSFPQGEFLIKPAHDQKGRASLDLLFASKYKRAGAP